MPYVVNVAMIVDEPTPVAAIAFVQRELLAKLGVGEPVWQTDQPAPLPRWLVTSVRQDTRVDEHGFPVE
jgi:hypothetical protein